MPYKISEKLMKIINKISRKRTKYHYVYDLGSYDPALDLVQNFLNYCDTKDEEKLFLNYVIELIGRDIETSAELLHIYKPGHEACIYNAFPHFYGNKPYENISLVNKENKITIELGKNIVITEPWDLYLRLLPNLKNIKENKFQYDSGNHQSVYYPYMNVCVVYNGKHSISCGKHFKNGTIKAAVYDTETAFKHIDTDGKKWFFKGGYLPSQKVEDFRYALLFQIAKLLYDTKEDDSTKES